MPRLSAPSTSLVAVLFLAVPTLGGEVDFARDVRPIFEANCFRCHGAKKQEGGLRLDVRRRALAGGDSGPAIVPRSAKGELLRRVSSTGDDRMPPSGASLTAKQLATLRAWVDSGANWPDALAGKEAYDEHWSFRPIRRPDVPRIQQQDHVRNPIDGFVIARLASKGLTLSPVADRRTLIRRLHLDLIGLPPTPQDAEAFVHDKHPAAYERLVDRLLASPHFGERWGRHWLDLARFAESDGYENDRLRPNAWRWRDWVIDAFNRDVPFDQFTIQQLAGDLLPNATAEDKLATGLHRNTLWNSAASGDKEEFRTRAVKDRAETTAAVWMGLTLNCAGCHSHKYDPIAQREYYQLYAFFNDTDDQDVAVPGGQASALRAVKRESFVHLRGNFLSKGDTVLPATPGFLPVMATRGKTADRLDLARWLVDPAHPLTARVAVNHVWQQLFGQGLVATPENFGMSGRPPSHPELLDWLASEFVSPSPPTPLPDGEGSLVAPSPPTPRAAGTLRWSRKALIRTIVLSNTYRQASSHRDDLAKVDPGNELLGRQNRFRVEAEIVRDLALGASGLLKPGLGGPSIVPPYPEGFQTQRFTAEALKLPGGDRHRRGVYVHVQRTLAYPMLATFDAADGNQPCIRRDRSTTPLQALTLLNDPVFLEAAKALGARLQQASPARDARLRLGFQLCLGRPPETQELAVLGELVQTQQKLGANEAAVWAGVARTLMNLEGFITRE